MVRQSLQEKVARLKELAALPCTDDALSEIHQALSSRSSAIAAAAANGAAKLRLCRLTPEIVATFNRFMENPVKSDPGCRAKLAAVEALNALDYAEADVFLKGIRHVQMEPSFGPPVDTADHLRAACAAGLYRIGYSELLCELVSLMADPEPVARRASIMILTDVGQESCELLLRLKALQGDKVPEIIGDCFNGLMTIAPARSLKFVEQFLSSDDLSIAEEAALALGNSRLESAYARLIESRNRSITPAYKRMLLLPIALTRCDVAFVYLLQVVLDEHKDYAVAAVEALSIYCDNPQRREQIRRTVSVRGDRSVTAAYEKGLLQTKS